MNQKNGVVICQNTAHNSAAERLKEALIPEFHIEIIKFNPNDTPSVSLEDPLGLKRWRIIAISKILKLFRALLFAILKTLLPPALRIPTVRKVLTHSLERLVNIGPISPRSLARQHDVTLAESAVVRAAMAIRGFASYRYDVETIYKQLQRIEKGAPDVVIFLEDNILYFSTLWSVLLRELAAPKVVFQYSIGIESEWLHYFAHRQETDALSLETLIVKNLWPLYVAPSSNGNSSMKWITSALSSRTMNSTSLIWSGYGGHSDAYFIDDPGEARRAEAVLGPSRVELVTPVEVSLARSLRLANPLGLKGNSVVAIFLPPNQYQSSGSEHGVARFRQLLSEISEVANTLGQSGHLCVVCPHPRLQEYSEVSWRDFFDTGIREVSLVEGLAICSVMVTFNSAVVRFAPHLDLAVVNWDAYGYGTSAEWFPAGGIEVRQVTGVRGCIEASLELVYRSRCATNLSMEANEPRQALSRFLSDF